LNSLSALKLLDPVTRGNDPSSICNSTRSEAHADSRGQHVHLDGQHSLDGGHCLVPALHGCCCSDYGWTQRASMPRLNRWEREKAQA
jgi:hypothetical protein